jgi:hypothetical protein
MKRNKKEKKYRRLLVISLFIILVTMSAAQALVKNDGNSNLPPIMPLVNDAFFTWEDNFNTMEWIDSDPGMSYNFVVSGGKVRIKNTYEVWTDSDWTKLKPITLNNNAGEPLTDYAIHLVVNHDPDMKDDYGDIRFKHEDYPTTWLDYWIEIYDSSEAEVWVKIPSVPTGQSMMYLFYGNPNAVDQSDFSSVFTEWIEKWANDEKLSIKGYNEGAWVPDVAYGSASGGRFLVAWTEGETSPFIKQEIRGSILDSNGNVVVEDMGILEEEGLQYRNNNQAVEYGGGTFVVAWHRFDKNTPLDWTTTDIWARTVSPGGSKGPIKYICEEPNCQADANIAYDSVNNRFLIIWEDARNGVGNYNIYGKLYDTSLNQIGGEKNICIIGGSQCEPWAVFDKENEQYMIVWEDGETSANGPFDIWMRRFDADLNGLGQAVKLADGDANTDYNFPRVSFCEETEQFMVTWNDGDWSDDDHNGNVWATILDSSGNVEVDNFQVKGGNYWKTDNVPYLTTSYFVSYSGGSTIWGKLVSSEGELLSGDVQLSASSSADADKARMAFGSDDIFVAWEDERVGGNNKPDVYANMWHLNIPSGNEVSYTFGTEKQLILEAQITSDPIEPDNLESWYEFGVQHSGDITFDILDESGNQVIIQDASDGEDLSGIDPNTHPALRLRAHLTRDNPSYTPLLDSWKLVYIGFDEVPPETVITEVLGSLGKNNWYKSNVKILLDASDGLYGSGVDATYFRIDNGDTMEYNDEVGIKIPLHATGNPDTPWGDWGVYYWSVDKAGNVENPNGPKEIKIDKAPPYCEITEPADRDEVPMTGGFMVRATATDEGSGIEYVAFDVGPPYDNKHKDYSAPYEWLCDRSFDKPQWRHLIAQAYDYAGHMYEYNIYIHFPRPRQYSVLDLFKSLPIIRNIKFNEPLNIEVCKFGIVISQVLEVETSESNDIDTVKFVATKIFTREQTVIWDNDFLDGCSASFNMPTGLYKITSTAYNEGEEIISDLISRVLFINR